MRLIVCVLLGLIASLQSFAEIPINQDNIAEVVARTGENIRSFRIGSGQHYQLNVRYADNSLVTSVDLVQAGERGMPRNPDAVTFAKDCQIILDVMNLILKTDERVVSTTLQPIRQLADGLPRLGSETAPTSLSNFFGSYLQLASENPAAIGVHVQWIREIVTQFRNSSVSVPLSKEFVQALEALHNQTSIAAVRVVIEELLLDLISNPSASIEWQLLLANNQGKKLAEGIVSRYMTMINSGAISLCHRLLATDNSWLWMQISARMMR